jgi:hypothetical protein
MSAAGALAAVPSRKVGDSPPGSNGGTAYATAAPTPGVAGAPLGGAPLVTDVAGALPVGPGTVGETVVPPRSGAATTGRVCCGTGVASCGASGTGSGFSLAR